MSTGSQPRRNETPQEAAASQAAFNAVPVTHAYKSQNPNTVSPVSNAPNILPGTTSGQRMNPDGSVDILSEKGNSYHFSPSEWGAVTVDEAGTFSPQVLNYLKERQASRVIKTPEERVKEAEAKAGAATVETAKGIINAPEQTGMETATPAGQEPSFLTKMLLPVGKPQPEIVGAIAGGGALGLAAGGAGAGAGALSKIKGMSAIMKLAVGGSFGTILRGFTLAKGKEAYDGFENSKSNIGSIITNVQYGNPEQKLEAVELYAKEWENINRARTEVKTENSKSATAFMNKVGLYNGKERASNIESYLLLKNGLDIEFLKNYAKSQ